MAPSDAADPEKDPSLFPESRVRPWVIDEDEERKVAEALDDLEKTVTFVSPTKHGLGASVLDRTLRDDHRGEQFFKELAKLEAERKANHNAAQVTKSSSCGVHPIGEVFEDLFRETHGLPPRRTDCASIVDGTEPSSEDAIDTSVVVVAKAAEDSCLDPAGDTADGGGLASDPDVAHLLAELQSEFDAATSSGDSEKGDEDGGHDTDDAYESEATAGDEALGTAGESCTAGENGERVLAAESGANLEGEGASTNAAPPLLDNRREQEERGRNGVARSVVAGEQQHSAKGSNAVPRKEQQQQEGRIDISRMKIDGSERGVVARSGEPRPRLAPSVCLSAGGFSRLSRTSSSHLSRTVSQKLLQAAKEAERVSSEVTPDVGCVLRQKPGSPVVSQADASIHVVKKNADALQASMSVRRTSYLGGSRPLAVRWLPRDTNCWHPRPRSAHNRVSPIKSAVACPARRKRPQTATLLRRDRLGMLGDARASTPLLTGPEAAFIFGEAAGDGEQEEVQRPPSQRQTTLGRMLQRAASVSDASSPRQILDRSTNPCCRPSSAGGNGSSYGGSRGGGGGGGGGSYKHKNTKTARIRPSSAAQAERGGRSSRSSPSSLSSSSSSSILYSPATEATVERFQERKKRHMGGRRRTPPAGGGIAPSPKKKGTIRASNSAARNHAVVGVGGEGGGAVGELGGAFGRLLKEGRGGDRPPMNVHQALEATVQAAIGSVSPREQFVSARKVISEMKQINTKDSTGHILLSTQGMTKARIDEDCWTSENCRQYV